MRSDRAFVLGLIGILLVLMVRLVLPYAQFVLGAIILAFMLHPVQERLSSLVGASLSSAILVTLSVVAILLPVVLVGILVAQDAVQWAQQLQEADPDFTPVEALIQEHTGREIDLLDELQSSAAGAVDVTFGSALTAFEMLTHVIIGFGLLLFLLYYFLRDGDRFVAWIGDVSPLSDDVVDELFARTNSIVRAVLVGHVLIAIIQGGLAGLGLLVTGIPNVAFWTFIMILLALVPLVGTFIVWAPATVFLYLNGEPIAAAGLFVYGTVVVGISDEYLRPIVVDRFAEVSPSAVIVGVIGGMTVFGFMGLFLGPIIVGVLKETIEVYDDHYGIN